MPGVVGNNMVKESNSWNTALTILFCATGLMAIGAIIAWSTGITVDASNSTGITSRFAHKHLLFVLASLVIMLVCSRLDYHAVLHSLPLLAIATGAIVLLVIVLLFPGKYGAHRWLRIGPLSFQPSELAKYASVILMARFLVDRGEKLKSFLAGFMPAALIAIGISALIALERDLGTPVLLVSVLFAMILAAGARVWHFLVMLPIPVAGAIALLVMEPFRVNRLKVFLDPWQAPGREGYQVIQSLVAFHSGGIWGTGVGRGMQKLGFLPAHRTDFVFAIIGEELGFIGVALVIVLFGLLIAAGVNAARKAPDPYGALIALGIVLTVGLQAIINMGVATSMLPTKGIALPLISLGGSSMVLTGAAIGLLTNIASQGSFSSDWAAGPALAFEGGTHK